MTLHAKCISFYGIEGLPAYPTGELKCLEP
jgi:hypothetical protein